jgi:S-adenosylmethionine hydrolase
MSVITLTTDLGLKDHYVASIKGSILTQFPQAQIVDISHEVQPFDILQASFLIKNCYADFPPGSVHILGINPGWDINAKYLVVAIKGHYFISADNGIFSLIFDQHPDEIYQLHLLPENEHFTFPTKDIFVKAACHILKGGALSIIGKKTTHYEQRGTFTAVPEETLIRGMAMYVDHYGNVISNISATLFERYQHASSFRIILRREDYDITQLSKSYNAVPEGERLALFSSSGFLEIAINRGNASKLLGIKQNDIIRVEFDA